MKTIAISGSLRGDVGKRDAKELRYEGKVPAVLYGGKSQLHFSVLATDLKPVVYTPDVHFVELTVGDVTAQAIIQDIQFHPLTEQMLHVDFMELNAGKPLVMEIPVKLTGTSPGVKVGGKLIQKLRKLRVKALPDSIPQYVEISLETLEVGKSVRVGDLKFPDFAITNNVDDTIVSVGMSRALKQAEQDAKGK
ncbi:50S ribosomal protein L25/general stress protein Ctc [Hufsiella ginkgonis]|uniref:Large ribosomal subunit protein bL25 n=1 Tax=Hufsiella ginkgonis TaxID=2695274 RepID=A0A7K1XS59_9SPHI|nr:50S ribosomal protein L25/general stress protein Ctc [Hufsiella ginkgonis]MXV13823.1 50S ribosomal protein L25/general stress protein Ctc [Hufsiella ginkgonis]